jgi:hypothetical protein
MIYRASSSQDGTSGVIVAFEMGKEVGTGNCSEALLGAGDRSAKGIPPPRFSSQKFVHMLCRLVANHLNLLNDDPTLSLHLGWSNSGVGIHVSQDFGDAGKMIGRGSSVVTGTLLGGVGIEIAPHSLDLLTDLTGGTFFCPLEEKMLQKVRDTSNAGGLVTSPHRTPDDGNFGSSGRNRRNTVKC